jgi:hypothetical protein
MGPRLSVRVPARTNITALWWREPPAGRTDLWVVRLAFLRKAGRPLDLRRRIEPAEKNISPQGRCYRPEARATGGGRVLSGLALIVPRAEREGCDPPCSRAIQ